MILRLRDEALRLLDGSGAILDTAREVSRILERSGIEGAVIGGVAVVLHGYVRTTADVDVLASEETQRLGTSLEAAGFRFDRAGRAFLKGAVPVHLVLPEQVRHAPAEFVSIDGVKTVSLADLIQIKLASGLRDPLRAIDLADVIGLIRHHHLAPTFAAKLAKPLRTDFRKLARAIAKEAATHPAVPKGRKRPKDSD